MEVRRATLAKLLAAVFVGNLVVMGGAAAHAQANAPPIPEELAGPDGTVVTAEQVREGKRVFQREGLMNHGTVLGNGAYFGVDLTADALALKVRFMRRYHARERYGTAYADLSLARRAAVNASVERALAATGPQRTRYSAAEAYAHRRVRAVYVARYHEGSPERGIPAGFVESERDARRLADFALWTAWMAHTQRPGTSHTYTNDWPYVPGSGNEPTPGTLTWSVLSVALLVGAAGAGVWGYRALDLPEPPDGQLDVPAPEDVPLLPSGAAAVRFVPVAAALFFAQTLLGGLLAHYYVERTGFFGLFEAVGVDVLSVLPFALARTYHIDLAVLWVATLWIGAGLFLPGLLTGHEPDRQATYVTGLLVGLVAVVLGGFTGIYLGVNGSLGDLWWLVGTEGLEYLEVGRLWKVGLLAGFVAWTVLVARGFRPLLERESRYGLAHLVVYAGGSIALLFVAGMLYTPSTSIVMTEFWRWWVVHMWVEGAFEFFVVAVIALVLVSIGLLEQASAEKAVAFEALLVMGTAVIGVAHHYWWIGQPDVFLPLGTVFSTLELIPLVFILFEATSEYRTLVTAGEGFAYRLPFAFLVASGLWNFVGAGALGFFINLPLVNYYEHGTYLTVAHAHAAMFGAFGLLALGVAVYLLRVTTRDWTERRLWWAFGLWNAGLAVMVFGSVLPVGILQLETAFTAGYDVARSLAFYERPLVQALFWARVPGDTMLIAGAALFAVDVASKLRRQRAPTEERAASERAVLGDDD